MNFMILQNALWLVLLVVLSIPLGIYIYKVMAGEKVFLTRVIALWKQGYTR